MSDEEIFGSDFERRVLAHLPRYREPGELVDVGTDFKDGTDEDGEPTREPSSIEQVPFEEHLREANGHDESWSPPQSMKLGELRDRLALDEGTPGVPEPPQIEAALATLSDKGLIDRAADAVSMSAAGLAALTTT